MYVVYKQEGQTPLEALEAFRLKEGIAVDVPMTYAGRLDPMAEGLLIVLTGDECKEKDVYTKLDKVYEFDVLVGVTTDTGDILGLITNSKPINHTHIIENIQKVLPRFVGTYDQTYPAFSSKVVDGEQLFARARGERLPEILPTHPVTVYTLTYLDSRDVSREELKVSISRRVRKVRGDFRQAEILASWKNFFDATSEADFTLITYSVFCGSGMYVRQLVSDIGHALDIPLLAYRIKRTKVGDSAL